MDEITTGGGWSAAGRMRAPAIGGAACMAVALLVSLAWPNPGAAPVPAASPAVPPTIDGTSGKIVDRAVALAVPPMINGASGKIVDRVAGAVTVLAADSTAATHPAGAVPVFAYGLGLGAGEAIQSAAAAQDDGAAAVKVAAAAPARPAASRKPGASDAVKSKATALAQTVPLPPARPAAAPSIDVAEAAAAAPAAGLLDGVLPFSLRPSRLLPSGRDAWSKVATLGEAVVNRLSP